MPERRQVGAVIVFDMDVTLEEAREALAKLGVRLEDLTIKEYNPAHGDPVWYIP
jgi:hypothetical protein